MSRGDVVSGLQTISADSYLTIQPPSGEEWMITNIFCSKSAEIYITDGSKDVKYYQISLGEPWSGKLFITNSIYVKVKNISGSNEEIGYSGVKSK